MRRRARLLVLDVEARAGVEPIAVHPHAVAVRRERTAREARRRLHVPRVPDRHTLSAPLAGEEEPVTIRHRLRLHRLLPHAPDQLRVLRTRHVDEFQPALRPAHEAHVPRHVDARAVGRGRVVSRDKRLRRIAAVDDPDSVRPRRDVRHSVMQRDLPRRRDVLRLAQEFRTKRIACEAIHAQRFLSAHVQQIALDAHASSGTGRPLRHLHRRSKCLSRAERDVRAPSRAHPGNHGCNI